MNEAFNEAASAILFDAKRAGSGPALVQRLRPTATPRSSDSGGVHISKRQWNWALGTETERERENGKRNGSSTQFNESCGHHSDTLEPDLYYDYVSELDRP